MNFLNKIKIPLARLALFIIYFWFGILKLVGTSPANPLVEQLQQRTLPFVTFHQFIIGFAILEMLIGILFLIPKLERVALVIMLLHMLTTVMPLVFLPAVTWQGFLTPTLEGQYIIKNLALIATAVFLVTATAPKQTRS